MSRLNLRSMRKNLECERIIEGLFEGKWVDIASFGGSAWIKRYQEWALRHMKLLLLVPELVEALSIMTDFYEMDKEIFHKDNGQRIDKKWVHNKASEVLREVKKIIE